MRLLTVALLVLTAPALATELPDPALTPGKTNPEVTKEVACTKKWGHDQRAVTSEMKKQVMRAYHFDVSKCPATMYAGNMMRRVEIDHLISRELGGADDVLNLWPQCYEEIRLDKTKQEFGAHKKDMLENELHKRVCDGRLTLEQAQTMIATDWVKAYMEIFGPDQGTAR